ncbi:MAG: hypothetical protein IPL61_05070 [Myxococcales bacterium]|nr:hypothetical protein [Myxococcales bacterium]
MDAPAPATLVVSATRATWLATHGSHPNVVRVLGVHHLAAGPRLMIEQVPGRALGALLDAAFPERLPLPELLAITRDCARGLHFIHELRDARGTAVRLIHGTLAPELITVGDDGVGRVAGLERLCATRGAPRPDPRYAAPEQRADGAPVDRRVDVFALAATLLRAATGLKLRDGAIPVPTSQAVPYVPQSIEDVLRKALAPDPAKRFQTAEELRSALERCVINEGLGAGPDQVAAMIHRYLPEQVPAPTPLPPRPDHSLWAPRGAAAGAPRWMPVESVLDRSEPSSASGFDVISVSVPRPMTRPPPARPGPNALVPAAAPVAPTMTVAALDEATEIAQVPVVPPSAAPPPQPPGPGAPTGRAGPPSRPPPHAAAAFIGLPPPPVGGFAPPAPPPAPAAAAFIALPPPPRRRALLRDPLFLVGVGLVLFFGALVVSYLAAG